MSNKWWPIFMTFAVLGLIAWSQTGEDMSLFLSGYLGGRGLSMMTAA